MQSSARLALATGLLRQQMTRDPALLRRMNQEERMKILGLVLIVLGLLVLVYGGFSYTKRKKVLDIGGITATTEEHRTVPISPVAGVVAVAAGVGIMVVGRH
jgi:hypothetical protein